MTGTLLARFVTRSLLSSPGSKSRGASGRYRWPAAGGPSGALTRGGAALLLGLPALSYLGCEVYRGVQSSAVVHALEKVDDVLEQADYLYSCAEIEKLYQLLQEYKDSDNVEFLWRLARVSRDMSVMPDLAAEQKKRLTLEGFDYAKKALEKDDGCFAAHKWYAVLLSDVGDYEGSKFKIAQSFVIRRHLERAVELNPGDATSLHILGHWCFAFAELPWYQSKLAALIFATPPTATYEEALEFFLKAEEVQPSFYSKNLLMLGKTYIGMNDRERAVLWLTKAKNYPTLTWEDKEVHKEALVLLKKLGS